MHIMYERCAGLDVHKKTVVACVLTRMVKILEPTFSPEVMYQLLPDLRLVLRLAIVHT
jgi:hypothetical protein